MYVYLYILYADGFTISKNNSKTIVKPILHGSLLPFNVVEPIKLNNVNLKVNRSMLLFNHFKCVIIIELAQYFTFAV